MPTTIHIPLAEVPTALTPRLLTDTILITRGRAAPRLRHRKPADRRWAGLNPHAGEGRRADGPGGDRADRPRDRGTQAEGLGLTGAALRRHDVPSPAARAGV